MKKPAPSLGALGKVSLNINLVNPPKKPAPPKPVPETKVAQKEGTP